MGEMLQQPEGKEVTICLTACGRPDLLELTIESFLKFNTYPIKQFMIFEDSGTPCNDSLHERYPFITWMGGETRQGQIIAIDSMYSKVKTPYIFHLEEDWQFYREDFIERSMEILEKDSKIGMVWLRELKDTNQHPIIFSGEYGIMKTNHNGLWGGFCFNPGLRRKADYDLIKSYSKHTQFNRKQPWKSESVISQLYAKLGFRAAILLNPDGYVKHIGENRHVS